MSLIYFIRHGESIVNITKEFSYKLVDKSLTSKGHLQATQLAEYMQNINFTSIYASPLKRARETAQKISEQKKVPLKIMEEFREINVGQLEKEKPSKKTWGVFIDIIESWRSGDDERKFPQGENKIELIQRFKDGVRTVLSENADDPVAIVGHGGIFMISLLEILNNISADFIRNRPFWPNCGITTIRMGITDGKMSGELLEFGNTTFLNGKASELVDGLPEYMK